jgi:hypothetical protein
MPPLWQYFSRQGIGREVHPGREKMWITDPTGFRLHNSVF